MKIRRNDDGTITLTAPPEMRQFANQFTGNIQRETAVPVDMNDVLLGMFQVLCEAEERVQKERKGILLSEDAFYALVKPAALNIHHLNWKKDSPGSPQE